MNHTIRFQKIVFLLLGAVLFCFMAFYNGYPVLFSDTGSYVRAGYDKILLIDRPYFYSFFLRHTSMAESLWFTIFAQSFIVAYVIHLCFKYFSSSRLNHFAFIGFVLFIVLFTGVSVITSRLLPDVFTPVTGLCLIILLLARNLTIRHYITLGILLIFSIGTHNSHFIMVAAMLAITGLAYTFKRLELKKYISLIRYAILILVTAFTFLLVSTVHYSLSGKFSISSAGHVFYLARLIEFGVVHDYLAENCANDKYKLCPYRDSIPWDFIWDYKKSPLYKTGGWEANEKEYKEIIWGVLTTPKYLKKVIIKSIGSGIRQFFTFNVGSTIRYDENSSPFINITSHMKYQAREIFACKQNNLLLNHDFVNRSQIILFLFSFSFCIIALFLTSVSYEKKIFIALLLLFLLVNALVCATFSGVDDRYQCRVAWLIVLPVFLLLAETEKSKTLFSKVE